MIRHKIKRKNQMTAKLKIFKIPHMNVIVIKQSGGNYFVSTKDSIVIDLFGLSAILKYLLVSGIVNPKLLEGVLEEYYSFAQDTKYGK